MALAETAQLAVRLSLKDGLTSGIRNASRALTNFDRGVGRVGKGVGQVAGGFARAGAIMAGAVAGGIGAATKAAIDFEDAFAGVRKTVEAPEDKLDELALSFRALATEIPITASELARIGELGGAMGINVDDLDEFVKTVALIGVTTDVSTDDAATALGQLSNILGITVKDFDNFGAALVDLGNDGESTESAILEITRRAGSSAKLIDLATDATLGWSAAVANLGDNPELAGTALQLFFQKSLETVAGGGKDLAAMGKIAGMTGKAFKKSFGKDSSKALQSFIGGLAKLPKEKRLQAIQDLFGKRTGLTRTLLGLADSYADNLTPALDRANTAWEENTALTEEARKRFDTVRSSISLLKNNLIEAAMVFGEGVAPAIGRAARKLSEFLKQGDNRAMLKGLGEDIGKAIDGIDWDKLLGAAKGIAAAFKPALEFVMQLASLIAKLPPELLGAGAGLVITNKLSGGAIGAGLGNIVGGLGETLVRSMASQIPVFGKAFVQPVFVTNMGVGLPGGKDVPGIPGGGGGIGAALAALGGIAGFTAVASAAAIGLYYGIPALVGSKPANGQGDANPIKTPGGGTIEGPNAGMVRLFTPALATIAANTATTNAKLTIIAGKPTRFTSNTTVNVNTSVSVAALQKSAQYKSRVARLGHLVLS